MLADNYFRPWVHYVPVKPDGSDMYEKLLLCERNTQRCQEIVANAHACWKVLFSKEYQQDRLKRLFATYNSWSCAGIGYVRGIS